MDDVLEEWQQFVGAGSAGEPHENLILLSWSRSRLAGLKPDVGELPLRRVGDRELRSILRESHPLISAATPHLARLSTETTVPHVAYVTNRDGIVVLTAGPDEAMRKRFGLVPGFDWSERAMGTNGAGTALAVGQPVAVIGGDHFLEPLKGFICTAAPIRGPGGTVVGAIDISTAAADGRPELLLRAIEAASAIERELTGDDGG